jgi:flagellar hook-associated protein 3 FlgL
MLYDMFLKYDGKRQKEITEATTKLSSGKEILEPSDGPVNLAQSLRFKSLNKDIDGYLRNMDTLKNTQNVAESALTSIIDASMETRATIVQILNTGFYDQEDANILKDYFQGIRDYIVNQANTQIGDDFIFSGNHSRVSPISNDGTYLGSNTGVSVPIAKSVEETIRYAGYSKDGDNYLGVGIIKDGDKESPKMILVATLDKVIETIESGDLAKLHDSNFINIDGEDYHVLQAFDKGLDTISAHRSRIGAQQKTLEELRMQHNEFKVSYNNLISKLEDVDFAKAATELEKSKVAYEATMASYMQAKGLSLLDYYK